MNHPKVYTPNWYLEHVNMKKDNPFENNYLSQKEFDALQLRERIPTIELAKKLRLSRKMNSRDRIDLDLTPYHKLPLKMIGKQKVLFVYAIAPTQSGKTLLAQIFVADRIEQSPGSLLYCLPTEASGRVQFNEKIISLIQESEMLYKHVVQPEKQTMTLKSIKLDNMTIYPAWSNSAQSMNSVTCIGGVLDEIRLMPTQLPDGGNAIEYMWDRIKTYVRSGAAQFVGVTTPSHEGDLMHMQLGKPMTQELWFQSECPSCGKMQILDIYENFQFDDRNQIYLPECRCKYCSGLFSDSKEKRPMNARGYYGRSEEEGKLREHFDPIVEDQVMIFRWTSEVSPFTDFKQIADKYTIVKDDYAGLTNFNQCWRARFERQNESEITPAMLAERISSKIKRATVPDWTKVLTAGVDSQGDGYYWCVEAHGSDKRSAIIEYGKIDSHHLIDSAETVRKLFRTNFERKIYTTAKGSKWAIGLWALDTQGNRTSQNYEAIEGFQKCVPCKGANAKQEENMKLAANAKLTGLYLVNTFNYLVLTDKICMSEQFSLAEGTGRGFMRQYCNLRVVLESKKDKYGNTGKWAQKFGQCDWRISHMHCQIALDVKMSYGTSFRDDLELPDFSYNPIEIITDIPDSERGSAMSYNDKLGSQKKKPKHEQDDYQHSDNYANSSDTDEGYGDFSQSGFQM